MQSSTLKKAYGLGLNKKKITFIHIVWKKIHIVLTHAIMYLCFKWAGWWCAPIAVHGYFRLAASKHGVGNGAVHDAVWGWTPCQPHWVQPTASSCLHVFYLWVLLFCLAGILPPPCFSHVCFHCYPAVKPVSCERQDIDKMCLYSVYKNTSQTLIATVIIHCS